MSTVTVPGVGPVDAKYVYAGGALVVGIVGYSYWRRSAGSGSAEVVETLPDDAGTGDVADGWGNTPGQSGNSNGSWVPDGDRDPATAAEWTNLAVERMTNIGYDGQAVASAIGMWLGRQNLTQDQADMIRVVKALMPAVPGYNPEPPITVGLPQTPGTGGGTNPPPASSKLPAPWLHHVIPSRTSAVMQWNVVPGAKGYRVWVNNTGRNVGKVSSYNFSPLPPGTALDFRVAAIDSKDQLGAMSQTVRVTTKK